MAKIKDIPKSNRPREKLLKKGANALSKTDLLAILLGSGIKGTNVQELAEMILAKFNKRFLKITIEDLLTIKGIGQAKALQIYSSIALIERFYQEQHRNIKNVLSLALDIIARDRGGYENIYRELKADANFNLINDDIQMSLFDLLEEAEKLKHNNVKQHASSLNYIDLFCGAGGFSVGFDKAGFNNVFSLDIEENFCKTYQYNFPKHTLVKKDIKDLTNNDIKKLINKQDIDVIVGGPPCQGFSIAGNIARNFIDDPRNYLFKEFVRVVSIIKPKCFVMENVARLYTHNKGKTKDEIILDFENIGYSVKSKIINTAEYGIPQVRKRVFFIGSRIEKNITFPDVNNKSKTVKQAIYDLPTLNSGDSSSIPNHIAMNHSVQMLKKMSYISDGGDRTEIPKSIRPQSGDVRKYIRYQGDKPSITVTGDMRKVFHFNQNRALTVRELARLQTFPDSFVFQSSKISQQQQVGNAVPPLMAEIIANTLKISLKNEQSFNRKPTNNYLNKFPKINFIGNKEKISSWICDYFPSDANSILDAFSGSCSIGYEAKKRGLQVFSNDVLSINHLLSKSLIENNNEMLNLNDVNTIFSGDSFKGFMHKNYANKVFFEEECMELDLYRKNIEKLTTEYKKSMGLILLRRAMIRKMPYSRFNISWDKVKQLRDEEYSYKKYKRRRAYHNASFKSHFLDNMLEYNSAVFDNKQDNKSLNLDVFDAIKENSADIIYLDPPYTGTMNDYFGFYGVIDSYIDSKEHPPFSNNFIDKKKSLDLFKKLFSSLGKYKYWFLSYNNNSYPSKEDLLYIIGQYSKNIEIIERPYAYKVTGKDKKQQNKEYLFIIKNEGLS